MKRFFTRTTFKPPQSSAPSVSVTYSTNIAHIELLKPTMDSNFWFDFKSTFLELSEKSNVRCIVLSSANKSFSFGLDVKDKFQTDYLVTPHSVDPSRKSEQLRSFVSNLQEVFSTMENLPVPVISCVHGHCIGGAVDLICASDIRYCTKNAIFSIKEVDVGLCPDLGTLQRIERIMKSTSLVRELAFSGRNMSSEEALDNGFVSRVFSEKEEMITGAMELAHNIAEKSPIAINGIKQNLNYSRGRTVEDSLKFQALWSSSSLQSEDLKQGLAASSLKGFKPHFKDLS